MKIIKNRFLIVLVVIIIFLILAILRSSEDVWICKDGKWIKHGNPSAEMPINPCNL